MGIKDPNEKTEKQNLKIRATDNDDDDGGIKSGPDSGQSRNVSAGLTPPHFLEFERLDAVPVAPGQRRKIVHPEKARPKAGNSRTVTSNQHFRFFFRNSVPPSTERMPPLQGAAEIKQNTAGNSWEPTVPLAVCRRSRKMKKQMRHGGVETMSNKIKSTIPIKILLNYMIGRRCGGGMVAMAAASVFVS